jgi:HAE1 family hydrophobic/amphiphilic exporter-1
VALTLVPLLCSGQAGGIVKNDGFQKKEEQGIKGVEKFYLKSIHKFLSNKKKGLSVICLIFLFSLSLFFALDKEFMPKVDEGQFIVKVDMPAGTLLEITDEAAKNIEGILEEDENVEDVTVIVGSAKSEKVGEDLASHQAEIRVNLTERRKIETGQFIRQLKDEIEDLDLQANTIEYIVPGSVLQSSSKERAPIIIEIKGEDLDELGFLAERIEKIVEAVPGIYGVKNSLEDTSPETKITIIKDKAWLYNLSVSDIARVVQAALKGYVPTKFKKEGEEIDIKVRLSSEDRKDFSNINRLIIHTPLETDISLTEVANLSQGKGPSTIQRLDRERSVLITANLAGRRLSRVIAEINKKLKDIDVPPGYSMRFGGENKEMKESFASLRFALILSVVLIYMIMAAQFESLWQPFIIMFTVPLSIIGVVLALFVTKTSINVIALLGMIVLGGIVVNNGIVLVSYINMLIREQKMTAYDAVVLASRVRLRPIMMTALTTILGLAPLALNIGGESGLQSPMAIAVIGGLLVSTFLTLLVIPALYLIANDRILKIKN